MQALPAFPTLPIMIDSGRSETVDWAVVERRGRRRELLLAPAFAVVLAAWALLHQRDDGVRSVVAWWAAGVIAVGGFLWLVLVLAHPRLRAHDGERHRAAFAVRHHLDPGPGVRERADHLARGRSVNGALWWLVLAQLPGALFRADWGRPVVTVPSVVVVVTWFVGVAVWLRRTGRRAEQWRNDPPGPERVSTPRPWTLTGRQWAGLAVLGLLVGYGVFVLIATTMPT